MDVPWYAGHGGCLVVRLMGAIEVFFGCATRPERTAKIYPQIVNLHPDCQGSLVSLVYNRGSNLKNIDSRIEMINIATHLNNSNLSKIPNEFRSMKRIWKNKSGVRGLLARRDQEATYFEEGLKKHNKH